MPLPGLSLDDMRRLLRKGLGGLDIQDLPDLEADELLNMSLWDLSDRFSFKERECLKESNFTEGIREYAVPNDLDAIIDISVQELDDTADPTVSSRWVPLERMSFKRDSELRNLGSDAEALPTRYVRRDRTITLDPTPDKDYPFRIIFWRTLASLLSGTVDTTGLPRNWDEIVVEGAIKRGHFYQQDYNEARAATNFQVESERRAVLALGKEEKWDSRYARLRVVDRFPSEDDQDDPREAGLRIRGVPFIFGKQ